MTKKEGPGSSRRRPVQLTSRALSAVGCRAGPRPRRAWSPLVPPLRDVSTKAFLRRYAAGALPPLSGSADRQANAFTRLPPLVAMFAGSPGLAACVERMVRCGACNPAARCLPPGPEAAPLGAPTPADPCCPAQGDSK